MQSALAAGCWVLYFHKRVSAGKARRNIFGRLAFYSVIIVIGAIGGPDKIYLFSCLFVCDHCNCCNQGFVFPQTRLGREARRPGNLRIRELEQKQTKHGKEALAKPDRKLFIQSKPHPTNLGLWHFWLTFIFPESSIDNLLVTHSRPSCAIPSQHDIFRCNIISEYLPS